MGSKRFSFIAILFSLLGAGLSWMMGELIVEVGQGWPTYLLVALYFGVTAMIVGGMILISQGVSPKLIGYRWKQQYFKTSLKLFIPTTLFMVGVVAGLFQWIYALEINEPYTIKDIVIAIDRSGSMKQTDPNGERFNAVSHFIDNLSGDKRVALMTFSDHAQLEIDFTQVSTKEEKEAFKEQIHQLSKSDAGATGIREVVDGAYELIQNSNRGASLILVSDGSPTDGSDTDIRGLVENYVQRHVPIYTIGMMYTDPSADIYLREISELTGGVYYSTSDTTMLNEAFGKIKYNAEKGTLITARTGAYIDSTLHKIFRVCFLSILALFMALALGIMFDNKYLVKGMLIGAFLGGGMGSLLMEILLVNGARPFLTRGIYWLLFGLGLMSFTWCVTFKDSYHGTREV